VIHSLFQIVQDQALEPAFSKEREKLQYYLSEALRVSNYEDYSTLITKLTSFNVLGIIGDNSEELACKKAVQLSAKETPSKASIAFYFTAHYLFLTSKDTAVAQQFADAACDLCYNPPYVGMLEDHPAFKKKTQN